MAEKMVLSKAETKSVNDTKRDTLRSEASSDVFTTTRHINYNQPQQALDAFILKFWSTDDAPVLRPAVKDPKLPKGYVEPVAPRGGPQLVARYDGEGCERVTKLMLKSNSTKWKNAATITFLGLAVFGALVLIKGKGSKNS